MKHRLFAVACLQYFSFANSLSFPTSVSSSRFLFSPKPESKPQLVLISGCTGTGKSTFGMSVALNQGILRCISTDSVREVMRNYVSADASPALHRSSYMGTGDPVINWLECCNVLSSSVDALIFDALNRGVSIVVEGVHVVPSNDILERWRDGGGVGIGCLLSIRDAEAHRDLIARRGEITKKGEEKKMKDFDRIRSIQDEMIKRADESNWLRIEQKLEPNPMEIITAHLDV